MSFRQWTINAHGTQFIFEFQTLNSFVSRALDTSDRKHYVFTNAVLDLFEQMHSAVVSLVNLFDIFDEGECNHWGVIGAKDPHAYLRHMLDYIWKIEEWNSMCVPMEERPGNTTMLPYISIASPVKIDGRVFTYEDGGMYQYILDKIARNTPDTELRAIAIDICHGFNHCGLDSAIGGMEL